MKKPRDGTQPLAHPRHEIYCVERGAGLTEEDALHVSGAAYTMSREPGEKVFKASQLQKQILRRVNARLKLLRFIEDGLDLIEHSGFIIRNRRAAAELNWFRLVVECGGVEPDEDETGNLILLENTKPRAKPTQHIKGGESVQPLPS
jgi:hypothetical protein